MGQISTITRLVAEVLLQTKKARPFGRALLRKYGTDSGRVKILPDRGFLLGYYLSGLWAFLPHTFHKLDRLALCKSLKTVPLNLREMNKKIFATLRLNESITLTFVKPFYFSYCHNKYSPAI